jgi:hypothetical protein
MIAENGCDENRISFFSEISSPTDKGDDSEYYATFMSYAHR